MISSQFHFLELVYPSDFLLIPTKHKTMILESHIVNTRFTFSRSEIGDSILGVDIYDIDYVLDCPQRYYKIHAIIKYRDYLISKQEFEDNRFHLFKNPDTGVEWVSLSRIFNSRDRERLRLRPKPSHVYYNSIEGDFGYV